MWTVQVAILRSSLGQEHLSPLGSHCGRPPVQLNRCYDASHHLTLHIYIYIYITRAVCLQQCVSVKKRYIYIYLYYIYKIHSLYGYLLPVRYLSEIELCAPCQSLPLHWASPRGCPSQSCPRHAGERQHREPQIEQRKTKKIDVWATWKHKIHNLSQFNVLVVLFCLVIFFWWCDKTQSVKHFGNGNEAGCTYCLCCAPDGVKHFTFFWNVPGRMIWDKIPIDAVKGMGNQNCNDDGMHLK